MMGEEGKGNNDISVSHIHCNEYDNVRLKLCLQCSFKFVSELFFSC